MHAQQQGALYLERGGRQLGVLLVLSADQAASSIIITSKLSQTPDKNSTYKLYYSNLGEYRAAYGGAFQQPPGQCRAREEPVIFHT
jgi:hypothetical protein